MKLINSQLDYYIAGLIEGDGNIWTPKELKSYRTNNKDYLVKLYFYKYTFNE